MNNLFKILIVAAGVILSGILIAAGLVVAALSLLIAPIFMFFRKSKKPFAGENIPPEKDAKSIDATFERLDS